MHDRIRNVSWKLLSDNWYTLKKYTFDYLRRDGKWERQEREAYDRGNGAAILLYDPERRTVILTRQFRLPTFVNGNPDGFVVEACAGILDELDPETCIRKEVLEETGYRVGEMEKIYEAYTSPGSVAEVLHFFLARYRPEDRVARGGGLAEEQEEIEVLEVTYDRARNMLERGEVRDAKTIVLLQQLFLR
ncbi:GDP-mannose pyrophosphatase NudK [Lewinella sp. IMCC34183]|uniref:GDP-mannose pyrophosphatase NudK n=1 Tax=Lewinella sp. IMCC34183 TaxID=2248762 RepID=UPI000E240E38|nr:GDP-mannose pyrophosphatase NudK [Lewinella sp. IMCC34183]